MCQVLIARPILYVQLAREITVTTTKNKDACCRTIHLDYRKYMIKFELFELQSL